MQTQPRVRVNGARRRTPRHIPRLTPTSNGVCVVVEESCRLLRGGHGLRRLVLGRSAKASPRNCTGESTTDRHCLVRWSWKGAGRLQTAAYRVHPTYSTFGQARSSGGIPRAAVGREKLRHARTERSRTIHYRNASRAGCLMFYCRILDLLSHLGRASYCLYLCAMPADSHAPSTLPLSLFLSSSLPTPLLNIKHPPS